MLIYAVAASGSVSRFSLLDNKLTNSFSKISMEFYLSHMFIFRVIEKTGLLYKFGNGWVGYLIISLLVIAGTICFAYIAQKVINISLSKLSRN